MSEAVREGLGPLPDGKEIFRVVLNRDGGLWGCWRPPTLAALLENDALVGVIHGLYKQARDLEALIYRFQTEKESVLQQLGVVRPRYEVPWVDKG